MMRLADFILANTEPILGEWEAFARSIWPGAEADPAELRDHADHILHATARDMKSAQTAQQQSKKSKGEGSPGATGARVNKASEEHAAARVGSGFQLQAMVAEYRALRASVIRLWRASSPTPDLSDLDDLTRFNESIDQSLAEAVRKYTQLIDHSRQMFLAILGHDLRNPLNAMMLSAQVLSHTADLDAEASGMASRISDSASAMGRMIGDLLDFTGTGLGGTMPISPAPMDLKNLCREVVDETRLAFPKRTLNFEVHGDLKGEWDAGRLRQVISNLLGNAFQHGAENTPVDCSVSDEGSDVHLTVHNQGTPIPPDALATIFEPLVHGSSPAERKQRRPGSLGLGLYIARAVVTAHGGTIDVKSSRKAGTVFTVCLPRHRARR
jgi:hypothetical protein